MKASVLNNTSHDRIAVSLPDMAVFLQTALAKLTKALLGLWYSYVEYQFFKKVSPTT
jgi:hypothetical protein